MFIYASHHYGSDIDVSVHATAEECMGMRAELKEEYEKPKSSYRWHINNEPIPEKEITYKKLCTALESGKIIDYNGATFSLHFEKV